MSPQGFYEVEKLFQITDTIAPLIIQNAKVLKIYFILV